MSIKEKELFINLSLIEICVLDPKKALEDWKYIVPKTIIFLREIPRIEVLRNLYKEYADVISDLNKDLKMEDDHFWECLVNFNGTSKVLWLTPFSVIKISINSKKEMIF